jgi:hypothetical protein
MTRFPPDPEDDSAIQRFGLSTIGKSEVDRHDHSLCDRVVSRGSPAGCRPIPEVPFSVEFLAGV